MTGAARKIRLLLADDHQLVRAALRALLEPEGGVVSEAGSGEEALAQARRTQPDIVLLDLGMPGIGGLAAARRLGREVPHTKVIVLTQYDDREYIFEALLEARAAGYLLKSDSAGELLTAVRAVYGGKRYVSPAIAPLVLERLEGLSPRLGSQRTPLTGRERQVLKLIAEGATSKEIASRLGISPKTAQIHRDNLKHKLGVRSTAAMVRYAIKSKLVRID
ncbi:MAG: response regulator transcription factor [Deltaproteobacteria bacterium]|nr:response regulator transcription factor [Deltaproteobacteria bacterium]